MANVNPGAVFEGYVREKVESGQYNNISEVVREALRLMMQQDRPSALCCAAPGEPRGPASKNYPPLSQRARGQG